MALIIDFASKSDISTLQNEGRLKLMVLLKEITVLLVGKHVWMFILQVEQGNPRDLLKDECSRFSSFVKASTM